MNFADSRSTLVISDVHLSRGPSVAALALARLVELHPQHELIVAGDFFDLALDPRDKHPGQSIAEILSSHPELCRALTDRLTRGAPVTLLAGNHDAAVGDTANRAVVLERLGLAEDAPLAMFPWFVNVRGVHVEHGHFYDPDNAPTHPLCPWDYHTEPLGIAMTRRFVAPNGAMMFAGAYETTPLAGLYQVLSEYRLRAPLVIVNYFATAGGLCVRARTARRNVASESERGADVLAEHSALLGVAPTVLEDLLSQGAQPTHHRVSSTFMRLYFDRIFATVGGAAGLLLGLCGAPQALALSALGACYLGISVRRQGSRYQDLPPERLRDAARRVRTTSGANSVIFGHSHVEDQAPGYLNLGSFSFIKHAGHPYAEIDGRGAVHLRRFIG